VESRHVQFAVDIYRKNLGAIKGKTARRAVKLPLVFMVPEEVMRRYPNVSLSIDIMFVNSVPLWAATSKDFEEWSRCASGLSSCVVMS
jgi:hypothetical protein